MATTDRPEHAAQGMRGRWLQIGLLAATAFAPLIARWQSLRDDDRAAALRERAAALRERAADRAAQAARAARNVRRALRRSATDASLPDPADIASAAADPLPDALGAAPVAEIMGGLGGLAALVPASPLADMAADALAPDNGRRGRALRASFWVAGVTAGLIAAGVVTYVIIRNRQLAREEREAYHALALDPLDTEPLTAPAIRTPDHTAPEVATHPPASEPDFATPPEFTDEDAVGAAWVGDISTKAYVPAREASATGQPSASQSVFFATEEDARAAGYHRAGASSAGRE